MKVLALVILCATTVFGQNPYEYVDDALLQRVGQIVFEYDQRVAASRSGGNSNVNNYQKDVVEVGARSGGYQQPQYNANVRSQQTYNNYQSQPQQNYQRVQRQYNYNQVQRQAPQQNAGYQYQSFRNQRQLASPYSFQAPQQQRSFQAPQQQRSFQVPQPQQRTYQEPAVQQPQQKSGLSGYILSEPIPVERVAEFHFTDGQGQEQQGAGASPVRNNNRFAESSGSNQHNGFSLA